MATLCCMEAGADGRGTLTLIIPYYVNFYFLWRQRFLQ